MNGYFVTLLLAISYVQPSRQGPDQKRLLRDLFEVRKYNVLERPVAKENTTITVRIAFNLQQIINLDEKEQYLDSSLWIEQYWTDSNLVWNPADYGGISRIRLSPRTIWRPDILMYNSANEEFDGTWPVNVIVHSSGMVSYIPPAMVRSICRVNIKWFPFDEQFCLLKFGSWTYDEKQVNITLNVPSIITTEYIDNGEFSLVERTAARFDNPFPYSNVVENYPVIALCFHLQRLSLYYYFNLIIPAALISVMALLVFTLPVDSGEKMGLSVTVLLSLTVFNMVIAEFIPRTSEAVPLLGIYFLCTMLICSLAVVTSVWVLNLYYFPHLHTKPPNWVRYGICYYLARILRLHIPKEIAESAKMRKVHNRVKSFLTKEGVDPNLKMASSKSLMANVLDMDDEDALRAIKMRSDLIGRVCITDQDFESNDWHSNYPSEGADNDIDVVKQRGNGVNGSANFGVSATRRLSSASDSSPVKSLQRGKQSTKEGSESGGCQGHAHFDLILKELRVLGGKVRGDATAGMVRVEWQFASRVIDRACLCLFTLVNLVCTVLVLYMRPEDLSGHDKPDDWPC